MRHYIHSIRLLLLTRRDFFNCSRISILQKLSLRAYHYSCHSLFTTVGIVVKFSSAMADTSGVITDTSGVITDTSGVMSPTHILEVSSMTKAIA